MSKVDTAATIADEVKTMRRPYLSPSRPRKMPPTSLDMEPAARTANDSVSAGTPIRAGKNSRPMLCAKNP